MHIARVAQEMRRQAGDVVVDFFDDGVVVAQVWAGHEGSRVWVGRWVWGAPGGVGCYVGEDFYVGEGCALGVDYLGFFGQIVSSCLLWVRGGGKQLRFDVEGALTLILGVGL